MVASSLLGTVAGYVIGSALVSAFLPWDAGYDNAGADTGVVCLDTDGDGVDDAGPPCDGEDNCPTIANPGQEDADGDGETAFSSAALSSSSAGRASRTVSTEAKTLPRLCASLRRM